jgi:SAM-dependent methyltransferase
MILNAIAGIDTPYILDIGASSGSTSLDLLELLGDRIGKCWITDLFFHLYVMRKGGATYFFHPLTLHCIMRVTDRLLVYEDTTNAVPPFGWLARILISQAPVFDLEVARRVSMIHPLLRKRVEEEGVVICEHDVFDDWMDEKMDVVKVANVLNRQYFNDSMIKIALEKLKHVLKPGGHLIIVDNRKLEKASLFGLNEGGTFELRGEVNGGCEIKNLVC